MSNVPSTEINFALLMNLIDHIDSLRRFEEFTTSTDHKVSAQIYEKQTLENLVGELDCVMLEANKRIRYLESVLAEHL